MPPGRADSCNFVRDFNSHVTLGVRAGLKDSHYNSKSDLPPNRHDHHGGQELTVDELKLKKRFRSEDGGIKGPKERFMKLHVIINRRRRPELQSL